MTFSDQLLAVVVITIRRIFVYFFFPFSTYFSFLIELLKYRSLKYYLWVLDKHNNIKNSEFYKECIAH